MKNMKPTLGVCRSLPYRKYFSVIQALDVIYPDHLCFATLAIPISKHFQKGSSLVHCTPLPTMICKTQVCEEWFTRKGKVYVIVMHQMKEMTLLWRWSKCLLMPMCSKLS